MKHKGRFGDYGGFYVPEVLIPVLEELEDAFYRLKDDEDFKAEMDLLWRDYAGRPTPLYRSGALSKRVGCHVYLKREDLMHGGAHKLNNGLGQGLLAKHMGKQNSLPKPVPASTVLPPRLSELCWAWKSRSLWAQPISSGRCPMFRRCVLWAPR